MVQVLIIRPGALGDTLMLLPALKALEGKVRVSLVGTRPGLDYIRSHVDQVMDMEGSGWYRLFMDRPDRADLPVSDMDVAIAFLGDEEGTIRRNLRSALPCAAVHVFGSVPVEGEGIHVAWHLARCLASAGLPVDPGRSVAAARRGMLCQKEPRRKRQRRIVFHPGSGSSKKNHPPAFWIDLITRFSRDALFQDFKRVILLGPAEEPLHTSFPETRPFADAEILISRGTDLLLETLDTATLYLGHDSGVTHLSALRCVPTVALYKRNNAARWGPLGPFVRVLQNPAPGPALLEEILEAAKAVVRTDRWQAAGF